MKGIKAKITKALPTGARLDCVDNTGAKVLQIIAVKGYRGVKNRYPKAGIGDVVIVSVKKGRPEIKKQIVRAVIVRQRKEFRRPSGLRVKFEDNAAVIVDEKGMPTGSEIRGPVAREAVERFAKIASAATIIV
ncbi:large subunit ribosomal protein L14 [Methanophagales archaeon]|nr:large subunit ribosomal protein L14 [Methanophagales archaeon]